MKKRLHIANQHFSHRWIESVNSLAPMILMFDSNSNVKRGAIMRSFLTLLEHSLKHRGETGTLQDFKSYRTYLQQIALKQSPSNLSYRKVTKSGFPKVLVPWEGLVKGSVDDIRLCMSVWRLVEVFRVKPNTDTKNITDVASWDQSVMIEFASWLTNWDVLPLFDKRLPNVDFILSNRAGPNGPATATAFCDLAAIKADPNLYYVVREMLGMSIPRISLDDYEPTPGIYQHSKLGFSSDKAGKTRIFAIGDWWSNVALSGVHKAFMRCLHKLRSDVTYRQSEIPSLISGVGKSLHTADMTAFTDRFPIEMEELVVSAAYGTQIGFLWRRIIQGRDFQTPKGAVRYSTGNPMGLLSSWAVSTMTHHAVKQWCAHLVKPGKRYKYLILGDDCCDSDVNVYNKYKEIITRLGVAISVPKSTSSEEGYAEFAKRQFTPRGEVTGLPIHLLQEVREKPEQFCELIRLMRNRGYSETSIETGVRALLKTMSKKTASEVMYVLSAPETLLGMPPLVLLPEEGNTQIVNPPLWGGLPELSMLKHVEQARREVFWEEVDKVQSVLDNTDRAPIVQGSKLEIPETHPALHTIGVKAFKYIEGEDEFSVYNNWMSGNDYTMVNIPSMDHYRYRNRAHKSAKSRYDILRRTKAFANGSREHRTQLPVPITNYQLFDLTFPKS